MSPRGITVYGAMASFGSWKSFTNDNHAGLTVPDKVVCVSQVTFRQAGYGTVRVDVIPSELPYNNIRFVVI